MSNYTFASMPSVSISRSKFHRPFAHNTSFNLGELVVLGFDECIPGSTHKVDLGSLVRMSTPIAPIMDDIQFDVYAFFCPARLTWTHWKQFMGESDQAGIATTTYTIPTVPYFIGSNVNTLADDLGLVAKETVTSTSGDPEISALPFRGFALIYNRWFRNQNVEAPLAVNLGDTCDYGELLAYQPGVRILYGGTPTDCGTSRYKAYKLPDYFTSSLPYAQKGDPVQIFGDDAVAPVIAGADQSWSGTNRTLMKFKNANGTTPGSKYSLAVDSDGSVGIDANASGVDTQGGFTPSNLWANLSLAVNTTINDLRFAFQLQKALEKDALYGSRFWEILRSHYSVTAPDASLQDPELLGHVKFDINISQVLQTTGFTDPTNTNLGTPGANSVTANKSHLFTASFVEHGYFYVVGVARQKRHTYSQGMNKLWLRKSRFDFYHPVFANIGMQKILAKELYFDGSANGNNVFSYTEAWSDYRYIPSYNSGLMNPARTNSLDYWTLAEKFGSMPTLGTTFLKEDRSNLARALTTGVTGPDFIGSFYCLDTVVNPMPLYSIPGFADHH